MNRIALGTVQFGLNYGINNKSGQISKKKVFSLLNLALSKGIDTLDTAYNYGTSEEIIGEYLNNNQHKFKIITKLPSDIKNVEITLTESLERLKSKSIYGYLFHNFDTYQKNPSIINKLIELKEKKIISKIGFSLYYPSDLEKILEKKIDFDLIQIPYNIFDQRFEPFFKILKERKIEIHVRSIFLQGLVFKKSDELNNFFAPIKNKIEYLQEISTKNQVSISNLCLNFTHHNQYIDKIIIGVDNKENLINNLEALKIPLEDATYKILKSLKENNEEIILPINWKGK